MSRYYTVLVSFGMLPGLLLAAGAVRCSEKETLLKQIPNVVMRTTDCLMECTGMTFIKRQQLQDNHNIRFKDSTEGDLGEYCWSTELKCTVGEGLHRAYAVLPVDLSAVGHEMLEVTTTAPGAAGLRAHVGPTTVAEQCGLRYDVTQHFGAPGGAGAPFCLRVVALEDSLGDTVLRCPPYLVTLWQRSQSNREGGG